MDDTQNPQPMDETEGDEEEEVEVTREELVAALQEVVRDLSQGLKGTDREAYTTADDLAQNDWFFAGVSDEEGKYAVTMWPAEGEEEMLRIDVGTEDDVHRLAENRELLEAMTDDFIAAMDEEYEEYEEYDEEEEGDEEEEDLEEEGEEGEYDEEEMVEGEEEDTTRRDGNLPPR